MVKEFKTYDNQYVLHSGKKLYLNRKFADVHFSFDSGDGKIVRVPAHKNLLAAVSDVFETMFCSELKENGDVNVVDVSYAAFKEFLQYFYLTEVKITEENVAEVVHLGDMYNVKKCVDDGIQFLIDTLNNESVCVALHIAKLYDRVELMKVCETFVIVNTADVFKSNGFLECTKGVLEHILKMKVLSCTEVDVFEACMAWVKANSGEDSLSKEMVNTHLGQLYNEIRFTTMSTHDLCALVTKYVSVLRDDFIDITRSIMQSNLGSGHSNAFQRYVKWNADAIVACDRVIGNVKEVYQLRAMDETIFSTNKPLLLGEFTCGKTVVGHNRPGHDLRWNLHVDVKIVEATDLKGANSKTLLEMRATLKSKDTIVSLQHPILVRPGFFYSITVEHIPDEHSHYSNDLKTEVQLECDVEIKFHKCSFDVGNGKKVGLISQLNFNQI